MSAPDRIWAKLDRATVYMDGSSPLTARDREFRNATEYVRADLVMARCSSCDGTGDVHLADGEWLGECNCGSEFRHAYDVEASPSKALRVIQSLSADRDFWKDRFQVETRARIDAEALSRTGAEKVKPLEWGPYHNPVFAGPDIAVASFSVFGLQLYQAQRDPQGSGFIVFLAPKYGTEFWSSKGHADLDDAKAAAQADYERRILSAIEPSPDMREAVEALTARLDELCAIRCQNDMGFDRETGPLGCRLDGDGTGCLCAAHVPAMRDAASMFRALTGAKP